MRALARCHLSAQLCVAEHTHHCRRKRSGALIVPEERAAFAAAVVRVLGDAQLRAEMAARGRAHARTWSSAAMARRLADIYGELRAAPRAASVPA